LVSAAPQAGGPGPAISRPQIGVLAVQGAFVEHEAALADVGADALQVRRPEQLAGLDGLVIPGGESTTFGLVAERSGLLEAVRRAVVHDRLPTLGTCAGMIMLARETAGGPQPLVRAMDTVVRRNAWGRQVASFEVDLEMLALGAEPLLAVFIRAPWIERAGAGVEVLASHDGHPVAAREGHMMVTAFHPELTPDRRLHSRFVEAARARRDGAQSEDEEGASVRA
jgi:5'-phosphate synthase pdxT subunit